MIQEPVTVRLELESYPENVALVRSALTGIADALGLDQEMTSDLKTALSEACNNVALHAYNGSSGPMVVEIDGTSSGIHAAVIDHGGGITRISGGEDRMGLGLAVISALASSSEFRHPEGGGTEVRMWFRAPGGHDDNGGALAGRRPSRPTSEGRADNEILVHFTPVEVMRFVLGRIVQSIAAASHFSMNKISDLRVANEAIARYIESAAGGEIDITIASSTRRVSLTAAPVPQGDLGSARAALETVVDDVSAEPAGLRIELLDRSREPAS